MVTAIVIPIIFVYFYWISVKERKRHEELWLAAATVEPEAILSGQIKDVLHDRQRFYYSRWHFVYEIKLQTQTGMTTVKKRTPLTKDLTIEQFTIGDTIRVFGRWENSEFYFSKYVVIQK